MNSRIIGISIASIIIEEMENAGPSEIPINSKDTVIAKIPKIMISRYDTINDTITAQDVSLFLLAPSEE